MLPTPAQETRTDLPPDALSPGHFATLITEVGTLLGKLYDRRMGLTRTHNRLIFELVEKDGQTQTELAHRLGLHKVSVGTAVNELVALGYLERRAHPNDGRAKRICLTKIVLDNLHIGRDSFEEIHTAAINQIAREDYVAMIRCMSRMRDNLENLDKADMAKTEGK
ncbi:MAG: MarR family transcriptional regulator [Rhizobiales bacterium]|nr:MarR family transcriptional regulator [Hyphomicrobiales bacterium]